TVDLGYTKYQGVVNAKTGNTQFLGMRYAKAPTGDLRWREPQEPDRVPGIETAHSLPPNCPRGAMGLQPANPFRTQEGSRLPTRHSSPNKRRVVYSEDCLFLNVFVSGRLNATTSDSERKRMPVVVWIHGGGYIGGGIGNDGNDLITAAHGKVVVVQMQYRIGVFGFLAGVEVKKHGVLNAGLLDQQFALKWVQHHIHKFGGDSSKVTIWGQSAGAGSVIQHLVANNGHTTPPLFRSAITSSTFLPSQYPFDGSVPESIFNYTITRAGCNKAKNPLGCLRNMSTNELIAVNVDVCTSGFYGTFVFAPVVDGTFIKERPSEMLKQGKLNTDTLLTMTNTYEGVGFVDSSWSSTVQEYISNLLPLLPERHAADGGRLYHGLGTTAEQIGLIMGDSIFTCPTYSLLQGVRGGAYKGHFAVPPARHAGDVAYYYPSNGLPAWSHPEFNRAFSESFLNFVLAGDPNLKVESNILPPWKRWSLRSGERIEMVFNRSKDYLPDIDSSETQQDLLERCAFWDQVSAWTGQ
ncbi:cephalosporin esterase, partial [Coprinellus micaceus]